VPETGPSLAESDTKADLCHSAHEILAEHLNYSNYTCYFREIPPPIVEIERNVWILAEPRHSLMVHRLFTCSFAKALFAAAAEWLKNPYISFDLNHKLVFSEKQPGWVVING